MSSRLIFSRRKKRTANDIVIVSRTTERNHMPSSKTVFALGRKNDVYVSNRKWIEKKKQSESYDLNECPLERKTSNLCS